MQRCGVSVHRFPVILLPCTYCLYVPFQMKYSEPSISVSVCSTKERDDQPLSPTSSVVSNDTDGGGGGGTVVSRGRGRRRQGNCFPASISIHSKTPVEGKSFLLIYGGEKKNVIRNRTS